MPRIEPGGRREIGWLNYGIARIAALVTKSEPMHIFTTLARHRGLFRRWLFFASALMPGGKLPRRDTELVILKVANLAGCDYEWTHHQRIGRQAGLRQEEIDRIPEGSGAAGWSAHDQTLLRACEELHEQGEVSDELWQELRSRLDEKGCIELLMLIGHYEMLAMTLKSLRIQVEPSLAKAAPVAR